MKNKIQLGSLLALIILMPAMTCHKTYTGIVTLTQVRKSALNELGILHRQGLIDEGTDKKIEMADARYREAARVAEVALVAYKNGGQQSDYLNALEAVRLTVSELIGILMPLKPVTAQPLSIQLAAAKSL